MNERMKKIIVGFLSLYMGSVSITSMALAAQSEPKKPEEVRVVVVSAFEIGKDSGDEAGEFQNWVEKLPLTKEIIAKDNAHGLYRYNPKLHVLGVVSGEGHISAAQSITALLHDRRFDLSHAYFMLVGIAGGDPYRITLGSTAWARFVVHGGLAYMLDRRDAPQEWVDDFVPLNANKPYMQPRPNAHTQSGDIVWALDKGLVQWAYQNSASVKLEDSDKSLERTQLYGSFMKGKEWKAKVTIGDVISSDTYWNGPSLNGWAERWVDYWTDHQGVFMTSAMEDAAFVQALMQGAKAGRIDGKRILVLRAVSNYDMPPPGKSAALELSGEEDAYAGLKVSVDNAYLTAMPIVKKLAQNWNIYKEKVPQVADKQ